MQSVRPSGLASEAGIQAGDQILECNGVSFEASANVDFADAVYVLKTQRTLDLLLRKGAANVKTSPKPSVTPQESSGYDSSSSSSSSEEEREEREREEEMQERGEEGREEEEEVEKLATLKRLKPDVSGSRYILSDKDCIKGRIFLQ